MSGAAHWSIDLRTGTPDETRRVGQLLGGAATPGWVVLLSGPLGAGKTVLAQGLLAGLGITGRVASPTFTLINHYPGPIQAWHADLYRLSDEEEFAAIGGDELLPDPDGLTVIEWADRLGPLSPAEFIRIDLEPCGGEEERLLRFDIRGARYEEAARRLAALAAGGPRTGGGSAW